MSKRSDIAVKVAELADSFMDLDAETFDRVGNAIWKAFDFGRDYDNPYAAQTAQSQSPETER